MKFQRCNFRKRKATNKTKQNKRHKHLTINQPKALNTTKDSKNLPAPPSFRKGQASLRPLPWPYLSPFLHPRPRLRRDGNLKGPDDAMGVPRGILTPPPGIESISHPLEMEKNHQLQKMCDFWKGSYVSSQEDSILKLDLLV